MGIKKIISRKNAGRIKNYSAKGDVELKKVNLYYGENGRGKTTLCAILRSLLDGEPDHLIGRTTLGTGGIPSIQIQTDTGQIHFRDLTWTETLPNIVIFDHDFISENVFDGNIVGTEQRKNLYKIIIGKEGVLIAEQYEDVKKQATEMTKNISALSNSISVHLPKGITLQYFQTYQSNPHIDELIETANRELTAGKESSTIAVHRAFSAIQLPEIPNDIELILAKNLDGLSAEVEAKVKAHIAKHDMGKSGQGWISKGLEYNPEKECPYCGQDTTSNDLIQTYRTLFGNEYAELKEEITQKGKSFSAAFGPEAVIPILSSIEENKNTDLFWKRYCTYESPPVIDVEAIKPLFIEVSEQVLQILRLKVQNPLEALSLSEDCKGAIKKYSDFFPVIHDYNETVAQINSQIQQRKESSGKANIEALENNLARFSILKKRFEEPFSTQCAELKQLQNKKNEIENDKEILKEKLDKYGEETIEKYQYSINNYLDLFNAGFQIGEVKQNYVGGVNANFQIRINDTLVKLGDGKTAKNQPSFSNTLSSGDKSTLALAFFLAQLEHDPKKANKIAILDDPFNSQDSFRKNQTAIQIAKLSKQCEQVIVLSHDANFLKQVQEKIHGETLRAFHLTPIGTDNTYIDEMDLDKFLKSGLHKMIDTLQMYSTDTNSVKAEDVVQKIRPLMEGYCRNRCMTRFTDTHMLGEMLSQIKTEGAKHPLFDIYEELDEINDYSCKFHHPQGTRQSPVINTTELLGYVRRTLRLVGAS